MYRLLSNQLFSKFRTMKRHLPLVELFVLIIIFFVAILLLTLSVVSEVQKLVILDVIVLGSCGNRFKLVQKRIVLAPLVYRQSGLSFLKYVLITLLQENPLILVGGVFAITCLVYGVVTLDVILMLNLCAVTLVALSINFPHYLNSILLGITLLAQYLILKNPAIGAILMMFLIGVNGYFIHYKFEFYRQVRTRKRGNRLNIKGPWINFILRSILYYWTMVVQTVLIVSVAVAVSYLLTDKLLIFVLILPMLVFTEGFLISEVLKNDQSQDGRLQFIQFANRRFKRYFFGEIVYRLFLPIMVSFLMNTVLWGMGVVSWMVWFSTVLISVVILVVYTQAQAKSTIYHRKYPHFLVEYVLFMSIMALNFLLVGE